MNHIYKILFFFLLASNALGQQNLILNGDFEEYWECPNNETQIELCKHVYNPLYYPPPAWSSTSDYFNECSQFNPNVPNTYVGYQQARSGKAFVGIVWTKNNGFYYNEYFQLEFSEELKPGITYQMSIYCNLANSAEYSSKNIQVHFTKENLDYSIYLNEIMEPDFRNEILVIDTLNWTEITFDYIAKGGEKYVVIGNFDSPNETEFEFLYDLPLFDNPNLCYIYFDDAQLLEISIPICLPNVFSPNGDNINDTLFVLSGEEQIKKIIILNRWGQKVYESEGVIFWDGKNYNGNLVNDGVYFICLEPKFYQEEKKEQYYGMVHLIR